jgi:hypothetical protein
MRMFCEVDTKDTATIRSEVTSIYLSLFPASSPAFISEAFHWAEDSFLGRHPDFQAIDAKYHDMEHTLQVTLCYVRLLKGYQCAGVSPPLTPRMFELALLAILLHDTGYLKRRNDTQGTGAKYTLTHVSRSNDFAEKLLSEKGLAPTEIRSVQNMIRCTGLNAEVASIPFTNELERNLGFALATADLLGQMAAPDYIDKLDILFQEFDESNRFSSPAQGPGIYKSTDELRRKTPQFWCDYVLPKINQDFQGLYKYLNDPFPDGPNQYLDAVNLNIERLLSQLGTAA